MLKYIKVDYSNKDTVKEFYDFYQNILLENHGYDRVGSYQQLVENIIDSETKEHSYQALLLLENDKVIGGVIFKYIIDSNTGVIEHVAIDKNFDSDEIEEYALNLATTILNSLANQNGYDKVSLVTEKENSFKQKYTPSSANRDNFLLKTMVAKLEANNKVKTNSLKPTKN